MGTSAHIIVTGGRPGLVDQLRHRVLDLERRWSRFRADSELSRLNGASGQSFPVSPETRLLVSLGIEAWRRTGGAFDPTVLGPLVRAGYDRDFDEMEAGDEMKAGDDVSPATRSQDGNRLLGMGCGGITVSASGVRLPPGIGFDSGGIGKGLAADLVADEALSAGAAGVCVNLGGDLRARGPSPEAEGWTIGAHHPDVDGALVLIGVSDGAVATSTPLLRRWRVGDEDRHHLIDPRTGQPAITTVGLATVVASEGWLAEAWAKAVVLDPGPVPLACLQGTGVEGLAVMGDGQVTCTEGFRAFAGGRPLPAWVPRAAARVGVHAGG
jgi:thiamine biosynthesis lipoprotein